MAEPEFTFDPNVEPPIVLSVLDSLEPEARELLEAQISEWWA